MKDADPQSLQRWFRPGRFLILLGLVILAAYPDVILGTNTFVTRDFAYFGYPLAYYHRIRFWAGEIPLWNPLNNCGLPFLAQWNTMALYPGSLFYLLFPLSWSLGLFCLFHLMLGGLGMYFLAWNWSRHRLGACVAGMAFATNGLTLNSLMWPNNISALGWMPWVVLLVEWGWRKGGRHQLLAGVVGAMQMLTGAPEIILLTWIFILGLATLQLMSAAEFRSAIASRFLACVALVALLSSGQLLPFLDLLVHSHRNPEFAESDWPMPGTGWANFLVPLFNCFRTSHGTYFQPGQFWTTSYYAGAFVLAVSVLAVLLQRDRRIVPPAVFALLGLILAMGDNGYLYSLLKKTLPLTGFMRFSIKFVVWTIFCLPILAAFGIKTVFRFHSAADFSALKRTTIIGAVFTLLSGTLVWFARFHPVEGEDWKITALSGLSRVGFLWGGIALLFLIRRSRSPQQSILIGSALVLLAGLDPMTYALEKTPTAHRTVYQPNTLQLIPRPEVGQSRAVTTYWAHRKFNTVSTTNVLGDFLVKRSGLFANCNLLEGIPKLDGFYSLYLRQPHVIWSLFYFQTNNPLTSALFQSTTNQLGYEGLLNFLGASFLSSPQVYYDWTARTNHLPWLTGGQSPVFADEITTVRGLVSTNFDPRLKVFLEPGARNQTAVSGATPLIGSVSWEHERMVAEVVAKESCLVVVAQSGYHPWKAWLDDVPIPIWRANLAFQAMVISSGRHTLLLRYRDWGFFIGSVLSATALGYVGWRFQRISG